jgi:uncharacterized protein (AIM24 family)
MENHEKRQRKPTKSILKAPVYNSSRFNFKRDILIPLNSKISYATGYNYELPISPIVTPSAPSTSLVGSSNAGGWMGAMKRISQAVGMNNPALESSDKESVMLEKDNRKELSVEQLRKVRFLMSSLTVVYPINSELGIEDDRGNKKK